MPDTLFATTASEHLVRPLLRRLTTHEGGKLNFSRFADGELAVTLKDLPRGRTVLISSTGPHESRFALALLALDAITASKAKRTILILPYAGFARQDVAGSGTGMAARLSMRLLRLAGAHTIVVLDPHSSVLTRAAPRIASITALPALAEALRPYQNGAVVGATDHGGRSRAMQLAALMGGLPTVYVEKLRPAPNAAVAKRMTGASVKGKTVIFVDDIIDTGGTMVAAARMAKHKGAARVIAAATHGLFSRTAVRDLVSAVAETIVTDSLPRTDAKGVRTVSCAPTLAAAIRKYAR